MLNHFPFPIEFLPVNGLGGFIFVSEEEYHLNVVLMLLQEDY